MKRKHPIGYNIDGVQKEDYDYINELLEISKNFDKTMLELKRFKGTK